MKNRSQIFAANQRQRYKELNLRGSLTSQKFPLKLLMSPTRHPGFRSAPGQSFPSQATKGSVP